jgi:nucleolar GTP-binding protein
MRLGGAVAHAPVTSHAELESLFRRGGSAVDALKKHAKALRSLPVAELRSPTVALVGAPNVGKSSLIRLLSSGTPIVANYPFTTRGVAMGHVISADGTYRAVLTDTPGVLLRPDEARNRMERLTLAVLAFLPCGVMFVLDASGGCGVSLADQLTIRSELRTRFPDKPWLDVLSKWDLVQGGQAAFADDVAVLPDQLHAGALRVSVTSGLGNDQLREQVQELLLKSVALTASL